MSPTLINLFGWLPATIIPIATLIQLVSIIKNKSAVGVSTITWFLFGIANIGLYIYAEKYFHWQSILGFLGTAIMDFVIAGVAFFSVGKKSS